MAGGDAQVPCELSGLMRSDTRLRILSGHPPLYNKPLPPVLGEDQDPKIREVMSEWGLLDQPHPL